ncbi:MAG: hypothetical protein AAFY20_23400 [Cyanobacteria bacterium J06639_14]
MNAASNPIARLWRWLIKAIGIRSIQPKPQAIAPDIPFTPLGANGRQVSRWGGVLPATPRHRHLLVCQHLRDVPGQRRPYKVESLATHEVWIWYQRSGDLAGKHLLFRGQYDCGGALIAEAEKVMPDWSKRAAMIAVGRDVDMTAKRACRLLAQRMLSAKKDFMVLRTDKDEHLWWWDSEVKRCINAATTTYTRRSTL